MKKPRKADDLDELKQELDIDYHKITPEELYQRFQTHPENVSINRHYSDSKYNINKSRSIIHVENMNFLL